MPRSLLSPFGKWRCSGPRTEWIFRKTWASGAGELLGQGLIEIPVDGDIGIRANALPDFHADPADRIVVATALTGHRLVTADDRILEWSGSLDRLDARR